MGQIMIQQGKKYSLKHLIVFPFTCAPVAAGLILLLSVFQALLPALKVMVIAQFIDTALQIAGGAHTGDTIYFSLALIAGVVIYELISENFRRLLLQDIQLKLRKKLCFEILKKQASLKYRLIEDDEAWNLITRISTNVTSFSYQPEVRISEGYSALLEVVAIVVSFISVLSIIATYAVWIAVLLSVFFVPLFFLAIKNGKKQYDTVKENAESLRRHMYLCQVLTDREFVEERSLFGYTNYFSEQFRHFFELGRKIFVRMRLQWAIHQKLSGFIMGVVLCGVFVALLEPVSSGVMSAGVLIALVQAIISMTTVVSGRLVQLIFSTSNNREFLKDLTTFFSLEEAEGAIDPPERGLTLSKLEFCHVSFRYPGSENYILRDVSFTIEDKKHYSFVGVNGAGKTTITKLITGLYDNYEGEIKINGVELRDIPGEKLKGYSTCVFQDFAKYQMTIFDNIAVGAIGDEKIAEKIEHVMDDIELRQTIEAFPKGLLQPLGRLEEEGQDVSGGQWQRIAIARAAVSSAPLRILDEPTAALDPVTESRVYEQFEKISRGTATIFISHRLGSTKLADEIFVIDGGRIVERGNHELLMMTSGLYAQMYNSQRGWYQ